MELFLLRHADADTEASSDDARRLSEKGIIQAQKVGRFCEAHQIEPQLVLSSPVRRAHETARIVCDLLRAELIPVRWLACGMHPETGLDQLKEYSEFERVMIVGHEPDFSMLVAHLTGLPDAERVHIRKASLTGLAVPLLVQGAARFEFSVPCRLM
jgi:phosphohistidine phosphatase